MHLDDRPAGLFGCWKRGIKETWKAGGAPLSDFERAKLQREIEAERRRREKEEAKRHREVAEDAAALWEGYQPAPADHPYLRRKGVRPHGARVDGQGRLVLAMADVDGQVWSLQTIDGDGTKLFMHEGRKQGCMSWIGEPGGGRIVVAEGFATGASIHEAAGVPVAVAFDRTNLEPVARTIRRKWPRAGIILAADDDRETPGNPGLTDTRKAAKAVDGKVAVPVRREPDGRKLDFNDLHAAEGAEAVAGIILAAFPEPEPEPEPEAEAAPQAEAADNWEAPLLAAVEELNERFFVAELAGRGVIGSVRHDAALERERLVFSRREDIKLLFEPRHHVVGFTGKGHEIQKDLGSAWLAHRSRRTYREIALVPDGPCPPDVFNLWRGFGVEPKAGTWGTLELHLREVICSGHEGHYRWLLRWLAYCVQNPGRRAEVAVVLRGLKGTGKGMLGRLLMRIFRDHCLHLANPRHLVGNFNAHLVDALFLFLDEAFWAGDKQGEGTLKALITERTLMIEPKGVDPFPMPNRLKILMASNNDWVVPASADERRYLVLDVSDRRKGDQAYFAKLDAAIKGDEAAALLHDLLALDLGGWDHRTAPHTKALDEQKLISAESFVRYWHDCLAAGYLLNTGEADWPGTVVCQVLHAGYVEHAHQHGDRHPLTVNQLGARLRQLSPAGFKVARPHAPWNGTARPNRYLLGDLEAHRAAFLAALRIDPAGHAWPEEEP